MDPLLHYVHVTQLSQLAKETLAFFLHVLPGRIGINGADAVGDGTAATQCHAKVVYRVGGESRPGAIALFDNTLHPEGEAGFLLLGLLVFSGFISAVGVGNGPPENRFYRAFLTRSARLSAGVTGLWGYNPSLRRLYYLRNVHLLMVRITLGG